MRSVVFVILFVLSQGIFTLGAEGTVASFYRGNNVEPITLESLVDSIPKGSVVFLGEQHNFSLIQAGQLEVLNALRAKGHKIHIAMEFLDYTHQSEVNAYRAGTLKEEDFLKAVDWGSTNFNFYRDQILFPHLENGEKTFAINHPSWLSRAVSSKGIAHLSEEELKWFPPNFTLGRESYKARFKEVMGNHLPSPEAMERYFEAQSLWDESMSWKISELPVPAEDTIVVIVGQFHVEFGGGLPFQLQGRSSARPITVIEEHLFYDDEELPLEKLKPSPLYGPMADYLLVVIQPG